MATETNVGMSFHEILSIVFRDRKRAAWAAVVPPVIAGLLYLISPSVYRADTSLVVKTGREYLASGAGENALSAPTSTKQEEINSEIAILTSRAVIADAIDRVGLETLYPGVSPGPKREPAAIERFWHGVKVSVVKLSNVIDVSFEHRDPAVAAEALNDLIAAYQTKHLEVYAGERSAVYQQGIDRDTADLDKLERERAQIKIDNAIYDVGQQRQSLITRAAEIRSRMQNAQSRMIVLRERVAFLSGERRRVPGSGGTDPDRATDADTNAQLVYAQNALIDLKRNETALAARYTPENPELKQVQDQISAVQDRIAALNAQLATVRTDPAQLAGHIDQELVAGRSELVPLADEIAGDQKAAQEIEAELQRLETADTRLVAIQRKIDNLNEDLKTTRARFDQSRTLDDLDRAKVVSVAQIAPALPPTRPVRPSLKLYLALGLGLGIFCAGARAAVSVAANNTFLTADSVERRLGLPVLATVPRLDLPAGSTPAT